METDPAAADHAADDAVTAGVSTPVGRLLREERERQGLSEKDIADTLHITMHYVRSVEANQFDKLPGSVFAKGYVKSYAMLLGMDVDTVMAHYRADEDSSQEQDQELAQQQRLSQRRAWLPRTAVGVTAIFVVGAILMLLVSGGEEDAPVSSSESPSAAAQPSPVRSVADMPEAPSAQADAAAARPSALAGRTPDEFALLGSNPQAAGAGAQQEPAAAQLASSAAQIAPSALQQQPSALQQQPSAPQQEQPIQPAAASQPANNEPASAAVATNTGASQPQQAQQISDSPSPDADSSTIMAVLSAGQDVLRIRFLGESWVEVNDDTADEAYRDLQDAGDVVQVTGTAPFNILLGDAAYARLTLNGAAVDVSDDIRVDNSARVIVGL